MKPIEVASDIDDPTVHRIDGPLTPVMSNGSAVSMLPDVSTLRDQPTSSSGTELDESPRARRRPAKTPLVVRDTYERIGTTVGLVFSLFVGLGLWLAGAWCTIQFLADLGLELAAFGYWQWLIPVGISAAELFLWPRNWDRVMQACMFLAVLAFDVGTTYTGFVAIASGRVIPLFGGIQLPPGGPGLAVLGVAVGLLCAFGPERIGRWVLSDLYTLWRGRLWT